MIAKWARPLMGFLGIGFVIFSIVISGGLFMCLIESQSQISLAVIPIAAGSAAVLATMFFGGFGMIINGFDL